MSKKGLPEEKRSSGRLILPSLIVSQLAIQPPYMLTGLLLVDIALTFGISVGVAGQIRTLSSIVAVVSALIMGALSIRFKHKSLLMTGLLFISISALGCSLAPDFYTMLVCYPITGLGMFMVRPMINTLIAEHFPLEKRAGAIGWTAAGGALAYLIGSPVIGLIAVIGGWRLAFLGFVLPLIVVSLMFAVVGLPSTPQGLRSTVSKGNYLEGFKGVLLNRSAVACLVGNMLSTAAFQLILLYSAAFLRQRFLAPTGFISIVFMGGAVCYILGSLFSGRFVNRFGRKPLTVLAALLAGMFFISTTNTPNMWLSIALSYLGDLFAGIRYTASTSLTLEQVPGFRGTTMSVNEAAYSMGETLGAAIGGLSLLIYNYEVLGLSLGAMGVAAAVIIQFLASDPTSSKPHVVEH